MLEDKYKVLRTLTALSHIDGSVTKTEHDFIYNLIKNQPLDDKQKKQLELDFTSPQDPLAMFQSIEDAKNRGWLLDTARMLFFKDGNFADVEKNLMSKMQDLQSQSVNLNEILEKANTAGQVAGARVDAMEKKMKDISPSLMNRIRDFMK